MIALILSIIIVLLCAVCIYATQSNNDTRITMWFFYLAVGCIICGAVAYYPAEEYAAINRVKNDQIEQGARLNVEVRRAEKMIAILGSSNAYLNYLKSTKEG